ncbi:MAG: endonuclease [Bacteriovoracaceae bacterium]|nr:endonuclease [Bacteriovoracaceae bacterium]
MRQILFTIFLISTSLQVFANDECFSRWEPVLNTENIQLRYQKLLGKCDLELKDSLQQISLKGQIPKSYSSALKYMYKTIDNQNGKVCSVYTPEECNINGEPKKYRINCEHTWPKSLGAKEYPMVSDLHHLYPSEKEINNLRANHPFCEVNYSDKERGGSHYGVANGGVTCFEPQDAHKGNVARSMFYFAVRYGHFIDEDQEKVLRKWNKEDPVNNADIRRHNLIKGFQGNTNPFIEQNYLVDLITNF